MSIAIAAITIDILDSDDFTWGMTGAHPKEGQRHASTRLLKALDAMAAAATENAERSLAMARRTSELRAGLDDGKTLTDLLESTEAPLIVELLSTNMATLETAGTELRVAQAQMLREEGLTLAQIADLFGVTRQRISALLRQRPQP